MSKWPDMLPTMLLMSCLIGPLQSDAQDVEDGVVMRVMAANLTSGSQRAYEDAGVRILQGLRPDIVALQEFNHSNNTLTSIQSFVNVAFGPGFHFFRETAPNYSIPNGIISRWPIVASGSWEDTDPGVNDRGFAWARIDLPGTNDLYIVSLHLKASNSSSDIARRSMQATNVVNLIKANFPSNAWVVLAGDCNIYSATEPAYLHLASEFSDQPVPTDAAWGGDPDTNAGRTERYDYVFFSRNLVSRHTNTVYGGSVFPRGLIFDSRVYGNLSEVAPVRATDSGTAGMQHMGVVRSFWMTTNSAVAPRIVKDLFSTNAEQGRPISLQILAEGTPPLHFVWTKDDVSMPMAVSNRLILDNFQKDHEGYYSVMVSNSFGLAHGSGARVGLFVPRPALTITKDLHLAWLGLSNLSYRVESTSTALATNWILGGTVSSDTGHLRFPVDVSNTNRFYRVMYP